MNRRDINSFPGPETRILEGKARLQDERLNADEAPFLAVPDYTPTGSPDTVAPGRIRTFIMLTRKGPWVKLGKRFRTHRKHKLKQKTGTSPLRFLCTNISEDFRKSETSR